MLTLDAAINRLDQTVLSTETLTNLTAAIAEFRMTSESIHAFADNLTTNIGPNVDLTVQKFHDAVSRVDTMLANNTNTLQVSLNNFAQFTERLDKSAGQLESLIATNAPMVSRVFTNLTAISASLKISTEKLQATISTNQTSIDVIVKDVAAVTANLKNFTQNADRIVAELEAGKGLAGGLLKDDKVRIEFFSLITNLNSAAGNLSILASNLNARGLLYKPAPTKSTPPPKSGRPR
jgi:ABC-type transporter Mla subunit MlaD